MSLKKNLSRKFAALGIFAELWEFMRVRKKWWLGPIIVVVVIMAALIFLSAGSPVAPFIYTLF
jgi:hypothetical protein